MQYAYNFKIRVNNKFFILLCILFIFYTIMTYNDIYFLL